MKNIKIITIILAIILVTLVAFGGVYIKTQNRMENKVKDYTLGRELAGGREIQLNVATAENTKPKAEDLTIENYETVKKTIENRLNSFGAQDYTISLNKDNGSIKIELPEDANTDAYAYLSTASAKVEIKEKDANTELLKDSMVQKARYSYSSNADGEYQVILELYLTEEGQTKIEEIKNNYAILAEEVQEIEATKSANETSEDGTEEAGEAAEETAEEEKTAEATKKIAVLTIGGTEYDIDKIEKNKITIKIGGETTNSSTINSNINVAAELAILISAGKYPISYEMTDNAFVYTDITTKQIINLGIVVAVVVLVVFVILTIKYKTRGLLASISFVGFISVLSLILRYTNVSISIEGIGAIILTIIINTRINQLILRDGKNVNYKELVLKLIPVVIITLVFSFTSWSNLSSFGMVMFWGLSLIVVYNLVVTKTLLKLRESK